MSKKLNQLKRRRNEMGEIRDEIKSKLLQSIKDASLAGDVLDAIHNFNEFISALSVEEGLSNSIQREEIS